MDPRNSKNRPEWLVDNVVKGEQAKLRLRELGFHEPRLVRDSLQDGVSAYRAGSTPYHPDAYGGDRMWGETVAALGVYTHGHGWERMKVLGVDLLVNKETGIAVIVTAGDSATGREDVSPNVRYRREQVITRLVNGSEDSLFDAGERPEWIVYFLLHNVTKERIVHAELSRPRVLVKGFVPNWTERILIPDFIEGDPGAKVRDQAPVLDGPTAPVVRVQRRSAS